MGIELCLFERGRVLMAQGGLAEGEIFEIVTSLGGARRGEDGRVQVISRKERGVRGKDRVGSIIPMDGDMELQRSGDPDEHEILVGQEVDFPVYGGERFSFVTKGAPAVWSEEEGWRASFLPRPRTRWDRIEVRGR